MMGSSISKRKYNIPGLWLQNFSRRKLMRNVHTMKRSFLYFLLIIFTISACNKSDSTSAPISPVVDSAKLSYGDSVFFVKEGEEDNIVMPVGNLKGTFSAFPEGIELDAATGAINVDKSETGLRYRITFVPDDPGQDTLNTIVLLSGISYLDKIYYMDKSQNKAYAVYNGRTENLLPAVDGTVFDEGGGCNGVGVAVNTADGSIDLSKTLQNGVFGNEPKNGAQKEVELNYRISDKSNKALNKLKVKLYYFETADLITPDLVQEMNDRRDMYIGLNPQPPFLAVYNPQQNGLMIASNGTLGTAKPRPPCIFLVGRSTQ
jgi:hypothetical protein